MGNNYLECGATKLCFKKSFILQIEEKLLLFLRNPGFVRYNRKKFFVN